MFRTWPLLSVGKTGILTYGSTPKFNPDIWDFRISGLVEHLLKFAWEEWNELPKMEVKADMHCVTSWSKLDNVWTNG